MPAPDFNGMLRQNDRYRQRVKDRNRRRHRAILAQQTPSRPRSRPGPKGKSDAGSSTVVAIVIVVLIVLFGRGFVGPDDSPSAPAAGAGGTAEGQKLLAEAIKFDNKAYVWGGGHPVTEAVVSQGVDCSGLVSVSVYRAFGINDDRLAEGFRRSPHWKSISMADARAGDIMYRLIATHGGDTDHVVFVAENNGSGKFRSFEAYGSNGIPYNDQVGYKNRTYKEFTGALRFVL